MSEADLPARFRKYGARNVEIRRVAIAGDDFNVMRRRNLADPIKAHDPNRRWYEQHTGCRVAVELETLPAPELRARVEAAVLDCITDATAWERTVAASGAVRDSWEQYVNAWPRPVMAIQGPDPGYGASR
jgi:hypothetical protein